MFIRNTTDCDAYLTPPKATIALIQPVYRTARKMLFVLCVLGEGGKGWMVLGGFALLSRGALTVERSYIRGPISAAAYGLRPPIPPASGPLFRVPEPGRRTCAASALEWGGRAASRASPRPAALVPLFPSAGPYSGARGW